MCGMGCPPDGRHGAEGEEEAEIAEGGGFEVGPERLAEEEGEAASMAHAEAGGFVEGVGCGDEGD